MKVHFVLTNSPSVSVLSHLFSVLLGLEATHSQFFPSRFWKRKSGSSSPHCVSGETVGSKVTGVTVGTNSSHSGLHERGQASATATLVTLSTLPHRISTLSGFSRAHSQLRFSFASRRKSGSSTQFTLGAADGPPRSVGDADGLEEGDDEGDADGLEEGDDEGDADGVDEGDADGLDDGDSLGDADGEAEGVSEGS